MKATPHNRTQVTTKGVSENPDLRKYPPSFRSLWSGYVQAARRKGLAFTLTPDEFAELIGGACEYCGCVPWNKTKFRGLVAPIVYNGLDRVRNEGAYSRDNLVPCCLDCNSMKSKRTTAYFLAHVTRIHLHQNKDPLESKHA